mmetsp:Transcript_32777/g.86148  ORF Transcript_32777/g.86148 Transcript_32777/m.86148 type:complete len:119 (-) Transcript_32777:1741-2097(-)
MQPPPLTASLHPAQGEDSPVWRAQSEVLTWWRSLLFTLTTASRERGVFRPSSTDGRPLSESRSLMLIALPMGGTTLASRSTKPPFGPAASSTEPPVGGSSRSEPPAPVEVSLGRVRLR